MEDAPFTLNVRIPKTEVMETLPHGCVMWALGQVHFTLSFERHTATSSYGSLGSSAYNTDHLASHVKALKKHNARESVETAIIRNRRCPLCGGVQPTTPSRAQSSGLLSVSTTTLRR